MPTGKNNSYDDVPYPSFPFNWTHPDYLATVGKVFGLITEHPETCRVLELGCASGGNLIPMAEELPDAHFVGIDLAQQQITAGLDTIRRLGLKNIELRCENILDIDESWGTFDFIICHGVFSWVPDVVRTKILEICQQHLQPRGVAVISYNAMPGWHLRGMVREMMCFHAHQFDGMQQQLREAKSLLELIRTSAGETTPLGRLFEAELDLIKKEPANYVYHDFLEDVNRAYYFSDFCELLSRHGLQYLAEAQLETMLPQVFPAEAQMRLRKMSRDVTQLEQYMDFLRNRMFRQTLICHDNVRLERGISHRRAASLYVASAMQPVAREVAVTSNQPVEFKGPAQKSVMSDKPLVKAALTHLAQIWPRSIQFDRLLQLAGNRIGGPDRSSQQAREDAEILGHTLLDGFFRGYFELHTLPARFVAGVSDRPQASNIARLQATCESTVTNRRHQQVRLDPFNQHLVMLLDGKHDHQQLVEKLERLVARGFIGVETKKSQGGTPEVRQALSDAMVHSLPNLAANAILIG